MPKLGDIRSDGRVYAGRNKSFKSGEYWATMDQFLRMHGADWFERRARMDENVRLRAIEKAAAAERQKKRALARAEREALRALKPKRKPRRVFANEEERNRARQEYEVERRQSDRYKERKERYRQEAAARREARAAVLAEKRLAKELEKRQRAEDRKAQAEERARLKSLRPKKQQVRLTDQQRLEAKRRDKRNYKHRRRALLRGLEAKATPKQISEIKKLAKGLCFYCRVKTKVLTLDHIVPIAKGGGHTVDNIVFACHACNSEKRDLDPAEYAKQHGMLLV